jgi:hypothetical protein
MSKCAKRAFPLKIFFSRTKSGVEKLNYTFAVAASRLLRYKKLKF